MTDTKWYETVDGFSFNQSVSGITATRAFVNHTDDPEKTPDQLPQLGDVWQNFPKLRVRTTKSEIINNDSTKRKITATYNTDLIDNRIYGRKSNIDELSFDVLRSFDIPYQLDAGGEVLSINKVNNWKFESGSSTDVEQKVYRFIPNATLRFTIYIDDISNFIISSVSHLGKLIGEDLAFLYPGGCWLISSIEQTLFSIGYAPDKTDGFATFTLLFRTVNPKMDTFGVEDKNIDGWNWIYNTDQNAFGLPRRYEDDRPTDNYIYEFSNNFIDLLNK